MDFEQVHEHREGNNIRFSAKRMELTAKRLRKIEGEVLGKWVVFADEARQVIGVVANVGLCAQLILTDVSIPVQYNTHRWPFFDTQNKAIAYWLETKEVISNEQTNTR